MYMVNQETYVTIPLKKLPFYECPLKQHVSPVKICDAYYAPLCHSKQIKNYGMEILRKIKWKLLLTTVLLNLLAKNVCF